MTKSVRLAPLLLCLSVIGPAPAARGWGCEGHQIIALIAEAHMNPHARAMAFRILAAAPIDASLPRFCPAEGLDAFADSSTWGDDVRSLMPDTRDWPATAGWHFVDIPRGAPRGSLSGYCSTAHKCLPVALADQIQILRQPGATPQARAEALRFVIHLAGDIHQPLHTVTNNDRGGNCVPVNFFGLPPRLTNPRGEEYSPNLHEVWDFGIIEQFSHGESAQQLAQALDAKFGAQISLWQTGAPDDFEAWTWESHQLAEKVAYGRLPRAIPIEPPLPIHTCADDNHVSARLLRLDERLGDDYQRAAAPVIEEQLVKAGVRLAALLNSLWQ